jgi:hypothetical protein
MRPVRSGDAWIAYPLPGGSVGVIGAGGGPEAGEGAGATVVSGALRSRPAGVPSKAAR